MRPAGEVNAFHLIPIALVLLLTLSTARVYALDPPILSQDLKAHSSRNYLTLEKDFVKQYLFDSTYGGTYLSVGGNGNVLNDSKDIIFQTNVILYFVGMSAQVDDPQIKQYVDSAAAFVLKCLKWGAGGPGTWYQSTDRNGSSRQPMTWPAASEAYISWGLIWAYKITGNPSYLDAAKTNLNYQMLLSSPN